MGDMQTPPVDLTEDSKGRFGLLTDETTAGGRNHLAVVSEHDDSLLLDSVR